MRSVGGPGTVAVDFSVGLVVVPLDELERAVERLDGGFERPFDIAAASTILFSIGRISVTVSCA